MSDITLTTGIRQNLLSLQQTSNDLTTTQEALATGKKVNSAADNPSSYFTSQNLNQTANSLSSLLDQIGQGSQTINAATDGLTGLTSLLQQALSTAQQAQSASWTTAAPRPARSAYATVASAGTLTIDVGTSTYSVTVAASATLAQVEADINNTAGLGSNGTVTATDDGSGHLVLTSNEPPVGFTVSANAISAALGITTSSTTNNVAIGASSTRGTLQTNFNNLLTQINQLAADSGYNGINLLAGDSLTIDFNPTGTSTLNITGVTFNSAGLGLTAVSGSAASSFQSDNQLATTVAQINAATGDGADPDRDLRHQRVDDHDPPDLRDGADQHAADRRHQPGRRRPERGKRQPAHRADPAAARNLGAVDRQPGEPVGAQAVRLIRPVKDHPGKGGGAKPRRFFFIRNGQRCSGKRPRRCQFGQIPLTTLRNDAPARPEFAARSRPWP